MGTRRELQLILEKMLGTRNVYYQPAENLQMQYPAIRYQKADDITYHGDNIKYLNRNCYDITVIDNIPDNEVIDKISEIMVQQINYGLGSAMAWVYFVIVMVIIGISSLIISKGVYYYE